MKTFSQFLREAKEQSAQPAIISDLVGALNQVIKAADTMQMAHWNLRSSNFIAMHEWFGENYFSLFTIADALAEQVKMLDINTPVSISRSGVSVKTDEKSILNTVQTELEVSNSKLHDATETADAVTKNLLEGWQAEVQKMIWFIKSSKG